MMRDPFVFMCLFCVVVFVLLICNALFYVDSPRLASCRFVSFWFALLCVGLVCFVARVLRYALLCFALRCLDLRCTMFWLLCFDAPRTCRFALR